MDKVERRDTRPAPRDAMAAAVAESNATRRDTSHPRGLADAALDYRVACADVRDDYLRAMAQAQGDAERAQRRADRLYEMARANAKSLATRRRFLWNRVSTINDVAQVHGFYRHISLMLAPGYAQYLEPGKRPELLCQHRMLASVLRKRGVAP